MTPTSATSEQVKDAAAALLQDGMATQRPRTIQLYAESLEHFAAWLGNRPLTKRLVPAWIKHAVKTFSPGTAHLHCVHVRIFLRWANTVSWLPEDYHAGIRCPRGTRQKPRLIFTEEDYQKLLAIVQPRSPWRLLITLGWYTGMAIVDCCLLRWSDIDLHQFLITSRRRKTGTDFQIPFFHSDELHVALLAAREDWPPDQPDSYVCPPLVASYTPSTPGESSRGATVRFTQLCRRAGLARGKSFHSFRATLCTKLAQNRIDVVSALRITGHRDPKIFAAYATPSVQNMRDAMFQIRHQP